MLNALLVEKGQVTCGEGPGQASRRRWLFSEAWEGKRDFMRWRPGAGNRRAFMGGRHLPG